MSVLIKPIITEKMTADSELYNRYGFIVDPNANKIQIKEAVEASYGVSVNAVRTMNLVLQENLVTLKQGCSTVKRLLTKKPL